METMNLSVKEKVAYGLGDMGCNFAWQTVMLFLAYFYTDVYGLSPAHMGTMFLLVRCIDAVTDPIMGSVADRTRTRFGQFRPYLLWVAVPFGLASTSVFFTPDLGEVGKIVYAYVSYIFLTLMYTALNVPYCAMANSLTSDSKERVSLQSYRFGLSTFAGVVVALIALPLVKLIGNGNEQVGYLGAMSIMSLIAVLMFFYCFANTKERIQPEESSDQKNVKDDLKLLFKNSQWIVLVVLNVLLLVGVVLKGATTIYYVNNVLNRPDLTTVIMVTYMVSNIVGALGCAPLLGRFDKIKTYKVMIVLSGLISIAMYFVAPSNLIMIFILLVSLGIIQMSTTPLIWSMMSDVVDYERTRSSRSLAGLIFSTNLFAIKLGIAIGGAMVGWILASAGYVGGADAQNNEAVQWINLLYTVIPGLIFASLAVVISFYKLDDDKMRQIAAKLALEEISTNKDANDNLSNESDLQTI